LVEGAGVGAPVITKGPPDALLRPARVLSLFQCPPVGYRTQETLRIELAHIWLSFVNGWQEGLRLIF
jgi:hypothetical protein